MVTIIKLLRLKFSPSYLVATLVVFEPKRESLQPELFLANKTTYTECMPPCFLKKQNLDVERNNNKQNTTLDKEKDIQRNNLNYEYLSLTLVLNIVTVCLFVLIVINTCKRLDIASFITAIVVLSFYLPMSRKFR